MAEAYPEYEPFSRFTELHLLSTRFSQIGTIGAPVVTVITASPLPCG